MSEAETAALIEMTAEVVAAYVTKNHIRAAELPELITTVHASLSGMGSAPEPVVVPAKLEPPVSIKKSLTDDYLISMEDGKRYVSLKRHLAKHGLTPAEYRAKWNLPHDYPMTSPAYSRQRSELAKGLGLGAMRKKA